MIKKMTNKEIYSLSGKVAAANAIIQDVISELPNGPLKAKGRIASEVLVRLLREIGFEETDDQIL